MNIIRFKFTSPVHFGSVRSDYDKSEGIVHSDTLYAAIQHAWGLIGASHYIQEEPDFAISSLFPFYRKLESSEPLYFFPRPLGTLTSTSELHKDVRDIRFLDISSFEALLEKGQCHIDQKNGIKGEFYLSNPQIPFEPFMEKKVSVRNRVPRYQENNSSQETEIYYLERLFFKYTSGLFCLFEGDVNAERRVRAALDLLQDEGLGTDRHIGNGQFEVEWGEKFDIKLPKEAKHGINLSLFCPDSKEQISKMLPEKDNVIAYELIKRGGWITTEPFLNYRKKAIYMFKEGSVFASLNAASPSKSFILGKTVDLIPDISVLPKEGKDVHPIFRSGKSIFLPFNAQ
jgi:CRISPR type III-A-associated RAMP protein Csm4